MTFPYSVSCAVVHGDRLDKAAILHEIWQQNGNGVQRSETRATPVANPCLASRTRNIRLPFDVYLAGRPRNGTARRALGTNQPIAPSFGILHARIGAKRKSLI